MLTSVRYSGQQLCNRFQFTITNLQIPIISISLPAGVITLPVAAC